MLIPPVGNAVPEDLVEEFAGFAPGSSVNQKGFEHNRDVIIGQKIRAGLFMKLREP